MNKHTHAALVVALIVGAALGWVTAPYSWDGSGWSETLPTCEEDQVLIGTGSYGQGQWSDYTCGPAVDDF